MTKKKTVIADAKAESKRADVNVNRIRVLHDWGGVPSNFNRVAPGDYDIDDDALYGCGQYLLDNGHAIKIGPWADEEAEVDAEPSSGSDETGEPGEAGDETTPAAEPNAEDGQ